MRHELLFGALLPSLWSIRQVQRNAIDFIRLAPQLFQCFHFNSGPLPSRNTRPLSLHCCGVMRPSPLPLSARPIIITDDDDAFDVDEDVTGA